MDPTVIGIAGIVLMVVLLLMGLPLPVTFFSVGLIGVVLVKGWTPALAVLMKIPYTKTADFNYSVIPLFVLLSVLLFQCGVGENMFRAMRRWLGHYPGGMAAAVSAACAFLGSMTSSGAAANILMSKVGYPEMKKLRYDPGLALSVCAASGTVAMLIPPSTALVIYAVISEQSIAECLLAGFIPGFLSMGVYMTMIFIRSRFNPTLGPASQPAPWLDRFSDLRYLVPPGIMMVTIIGGLYLGIFTATEAAAAAALMAFAIVVGMRRLTWARLKGTLYETVRLSIMVTLILVTITGVFNLFLNTTWMTVTIAELAMGLPSKWLTIAAIYLICFVFGCFTGGPMSYVILPMFTPVVVQLGFSGVWFVITIVKMLEIGGITPPVATGLFIAQSIVREVPLRKLYSSILWFVACDVFVLGLFIAFPQIVTFLPDTMMGLH